jgi:hypothetical protein
VVSFEGRSKVFQMEHLGVRAGGRLLSRSRHLLRMSLFTTSALSPGGVSARCSSWCRAGICPTRTAPPARAELLLLPAAALGLLLVAEDGMVHHEILGLCFEHRANPTNSRDFTPPSRASCGASAKRLTVERG